MLLAAIPDYGTDFYKYAGDLTSATIRNKQTTTYSNNMSVTWLESNAATGTTPQNVHTKRKILFWVPIRSPFESRNRKAEFCDG